MKYVVKGTEPKSFSDWKSKKSNTKGNWSSFASHDSKSYDIYTELRKTLIEQQQQMCCYCDVALNQDKDAHIEHLKDQDHHAPNIFDFDNLLASCNHSDSCGQEKKNHYFAKMVSPLDKDCQQRFTYTRRGEIIPFDEKDKSAKKTITLLGLDCKRLKDRRYSIIKALENSNLNYLQQVLDSCIEWPSGFFTVIKYLTNNYIPPTKEPNQY